MKTNKIVQLAATAALAILASCSQKIEYKRVPFVAFDTTSITANETDGTVSVSVTAYDFDSNFSQTFKAIDKTAIKGTHYDIVDNPTQVLNFTKENPTQDITISITDMTGISTGALQFTLELAEATGNVTHTGNSVCAFTIVDNDVPVDWDYIVGEWTASDWGGAAYSVEIKKVDDTTLTLTNLWEGGMTVEGTITFDEAANTASITFAGQQVVYNHSTYGPMGMFGLDANGKLDSANKYAVFAKVTNGSFTIGPWIPIILTGQYQGYSLTGQEGITKLSK